MFGGCDDTNKMCFVTLFSNLIKIAFPAIIVEPSAAMQKADILLGNDVIGPGKQLGINIPLDQDAKTTLSFWKNNVISDENELNIPKNNDNDNFSRIDTNSSKHLDTSSNPLAGTQPQRL